MGSDSLLAESPPHIKLFETGPNKLDKDMTQ